MKMMFPNCEVSVISDLSTSALQSWTAKALGLDFIWLGVSGRIGTSMQGFVNQVVGWNSFKEDQWQEGVGYLRMFLGAVDQGLLNQGLV